mgnify:FL=1
MVGIYDKVWYNFLKERKKMTKVYQKLKIKRTRQRMSCVDIAKIVGISPAYYSQIENKSRRLYYFMAVKIAKVFNMTPDELFYDD